MGLCNQISTEKNTLRGKIGNDYFIINVCMYFVFYRPLTETYVQTGGAK